MLRLATNLRRLQQILLHGERDHLGVVHCEHSDSVLPHVLSLQTEFPNEHIRPNDVQGENVDLAAHAAL